MSNYEARELWRIERGEKGKRRDLRDRILLKWWDGYVREAFTLDEAEYIGRELLRLAAEMRGKAADVQVSAAVLP